MSSQADVSPRARVGGVPASTVVGDRAIAPHEANLFDMRQKYADLMTNAELLAL